MMFLSVFPAGSGIGSQIDPVFIAFGLFAIGVVAFVRLYRNVSGQNGSMMTSVMESLFIMIIGASLITVVSTLIL